MAVVALSVAYFLNEIGAEYGLLSQAHYDMVLDCLTKRDERQRAAKAGVALSLAPAETEEDTERVADSATQVVVAQSTLAAVLEFLISQVAGQLSDAMGRRPVLIAAALVMSACKAAPVLWPSLPSVWLAKSGGEAANTIVTSTLLSAVSDLYASDVQAYGSVAGRLRALGGIGWVIGPTVGMRLNNRSGPRLSYLCSTVAGVALTAACAFCLPETSGRTVGARAAFGELRYGKRSSCAILQQKPNIYQDRLGTNIGKSEQKGCVSQALFVRPAGVRLHVHPQGCLRAVRERGAQAGAGAGAYAAGVLWGLRRARQPRATDPRLGFEPAIGVPHCRGHDRLLAGGAGGARAALPGQPLGLSHRAAQQWDRVLYPGLRGADGLASPSYVRALCPVFHTKPKPFSFAPACRPSAVWCVLSAAMS
jgi:MFS family permease